MSISDSSNPLIYFKDGANVLKGGIGFFSMSSGTLSLSVGSSGLGSDTKMAITPNGNIGIGTPTPNASAKLQLDSTSQGFLPPRMTQVQRDAITSPEEGLMIYQTDGTKGWYGYNGTAWVQL